MGVERLFERVLWLSRLVVVIPVVASVALACAAFYVGTVDVVYVVAHLGSYADLAVSAGTRAATRATLLGTIIKAIDIYLLAAVLLIFAFGLYKLFIGKIEAAERPGFAPRLLLIESVDDLKDRLAKVVLLVLIVEFLQYALGAHYASALDLLYLAVGIALIGVALYLTSKH
jgi:uncharacterized membrane protein YqhA